MKIFHYFILWLLVTTVLGSGGCLGDCFKRYTLTGTVVDSSLTPLAGVDVRWHYEDPNEPIIVVTTTDQRGNYTHTFSTSAYLQGSDIEFAKTGYITLVAEPYTIAEAGPDICGSIILRRDAVIQQQ